MVLVWNHGEYENNTEWNLISFSGDLYDYPLPSRKFFSSNYLGLGMVEPQDVCDQIEGLRWATRTN